MVRCNVAVVLVTRDQKDRLTDAIESLMPQMKLIHRVYLVNAGTRSPPAKKILLAARNKLRRTRKLEYMEVGNIGPAAARNSAFVSAMQHDDIDLFLFLDDDDRFGDRFVSRMIETYKYYAEQKRIPAVIVPGEICHEHEPEHEEAPSICVSYSLRIPDRLDDIDGWVKLTEVGATCGISALALRKFRPFDGRLDFDEWVEMLCRWARRGALFVITEIAALDSYLYFKHRKKDVHAERRQRLERSRPDVAERVLLGVESLQHFEVLPTDHSESGGAEVIPFPPAHHQLPAIS